MRLASGPSPRILLTGALFLGLGCGNPCATQAARVDEALLRAGVARADLYAPEPLRQATDALRLAREECRFQASRFFPFRAYRKSQALFNAALEQAERAVSQAQAGEGLARQEALNARYDAGMAVNGALLSLRRAREMKGNRFAQDLLGRLDGLQSALTELQRRIDAGEYLPARELGIGIRDEAVRLQADANRGALAAPAR